MANELEGESQILQPIASGQNSNLGPSAVCVPLVPQRLCVVPLRLRTRRECNAHSHTVGQECSSGILHSAQCSMV
jgi:hypothetical protein